jgi:NAD+ synthase (glutamine-hydrolysing)
MHHLRVGAAVLNQTPLDWDNNRRNIEVVLADARQQGVRLLCLPEMCITGYGCEDTFHAPFVAETAWRILEELLPSTIGMVVSFGLPVRHHNTSYNCACLVANGEILGLVAKQNLANDGIYYEGRWFKPWPHGIRAVHRRGTREIPIGDLVFDVGGIRIGFEICEDAWVAGRPGSELARSGVDVIFNPSASHFAFGKLDVRERFVLEGSRAFAVTYIYANLLGNESGRAIFDGGAMIATGGRMLATGPRFSFRDSVLTVATTDIDATRLEQGRTGSFRTDVVESERIVRATFTPKPLPPSVSAPPAWPAWERDAATLKFEEFTRAETLALFDYLRKSRSRGFVVSLSGGADSSAVVVLARWMVEFALRELGADELRRKLPAVGDVPLGDAAAITKRLLTTAYQSTRNSGPVTRDAAKKVAQAVGSQHFEVDVDAIVQNYEAVVEGAIGRKLTWETDDIARQNVQARARAPFAWMLANLKNALLLATSNRSEVAVGYATMDGDTAGSISPIAGIDKAFLRQWLAWAEKSGPVGIGPLPVLAVVNAQAPTAELRPPSAAQTDEGDLMPYPILEAIEDAAIRDKLSPAEVLERLAVEHPELGRSDAVCFIARFFRLWSRNQWKRERYAPSFHLDDRNLDPKTWCRFPILSGGFERELRELEGG